MKPRIINILLLLAFSALLFACGRGSLFNEYKTIQKAEWNKDSLMVFHVPVADTAHNHSLFVNVRNDIEYKYSNLWLFVKITQPGDTTVTDTFEITLANQSGKWLGKGFGGIKTSENLFRKNVFFPAAGTYEIVIQHGMRDIVLEGITDVGVRVERQ
jgi:gliding motility-associated lipoprotein GldH